MTPSYLLEVKRLYSSLLKLDIGRFLISDDFKYFCLDNYVDELWKNCEDHVVKESKVSVLTLGEYTGDAEKALPLFLGRLIDEREKGFLDVFISMLKAFSTWAKKPLNFDEVKRRLQELGFDSNELDKTGVFPRSGHQQPSKKIVDIQKQANDFFEKANDSLSNTRRTLKEVKYSECVENAQKTVEYALKSILTLFEIDYPKDNRGHEVSHLIPEIIEKLPKDHANFSLWKDSMLPPIIAMSRALSIWGPLSRYDDKKTGMTTKNMFTKDLAEAAEKMANHTFSTCSDIFYVIKYANSKEM